VDVELAPAFLERPDNAPARFILLESVTFIKDLYERGFGNK
jgi:hypothetical protein